MLIKPVYLGQKENEKDSYNSKITANKLAPISSFRAGKKYTGNGKITDE